MTLVMLWLTDASPRSTLNHVTRCAHSRLGMANHVTASDVLTASDDDSQASLELHQLSLAHTTICRISVSSVAPPVRRVSHHGFIYLASQIISPRFLFFFFSSRRRHTRCSRD